MNSMNEQVSAAGVLELARNKIDDDKYILKGWVTSGSKNVATSVRFVDAALYDACDDIDRNYSAYSAASVYLNQDHTHGDMAYWASVGINPRPYQDLFTRSIERAIEAGEK